jgi:hypothetical protein
VCEFHLGVFSLLGLCDEPGSITLHTSCLTNRFRIPRLTHARRLRELRRHNRDALASGFSLGDSMDAFEAAKAHCSKPRNAGIRAQATDLLVDGHERKQVIDSFLYRQSRVVEGIGSLLGERRGKPGDQKSDENDNVLLYHGKYRISFLN